MSIDISRTLLGGMAAGVTRVAGHGFLDVITASMMIQAEGVRVAPTAGTPAATVTTIALAIQFFIGVATIYLYAAMRPRFGAGARTAVGAGLLTWGAAALLWSVTVMVGLVPLTAFVLRASALLPIALVAALIGARVCSWPADASVRPTRSALQRVPAA